METSGCVHQRIDDDIPEPSEAFVEVLYQPQDSFFVLAGRRPLFDRPGMSAEQFADLPASKDKRTE